MFVITAVIFSVILIVFLILNVYWALAFIGRIQRYRKYKKSVVKNLTDEESGELNEHLTYIIKLKFGKMSYFF